MRMPRAAIPEMMYAMTVPGLMPIRGWIDSGVGLGLALYTEKCKAEKA